MANINNKTEKRSLEITRKYVEFLDAHIDDVICGRTTEFMELNQITQQLTLSHQHLTLTIQKEKGNHPCHYYDAKIIDRAKALLLQSDKIIADTSLTMTYDPSNFSKFFKKWTGESPGKFRKSQQRLSGRYTCP